MWPESMAGLWATPDAAMNEIAPPPKYRLNLRVVLMSVLIWMGTFLVFAAISVTLAITTNAMYFLFIIMGLVVSTFAMAFYKPEGPWEPLVPYSKLCEPKLETHAPVYVEEKSSVYPPSPSMKSMTRSDPWLCTSAKTTLRSSFSSPRLRGAAADDDTWPAPSAPPRNPKAHLPAGFLPLAPTAPARSRSSSSLDAHSQCEQVTTVSCHQPYGCYESRVMRTTYEEFHKISDNVETIECVERSEVVTLESAPVPEPPSTTIQVEEPVEPVAPEKKKRRLLWNIFSRSDDKTIVKEFPSDKNEDSESKAGLLDEEYMQGMPSTSKPRGIAEAPEFSKVVENIQRNIKESNNPYGILHKPKAEGAVATQRQMSKDWKTKKSASKGKQTIEALGSTPDLQSATVRGILSSSESSGSYSAAGGSGATPFWKEQESPQEPSPGSSSPMVSGAASGMSSASQLSLAGSTPKELDHQYLNEAFLKSRSSWDEPSHPESTTPFQNAVDGSPSQGSHHTAASKKAASNARSDEKEIWGSPSWNPPKNNACGEKASQTSLRDFCPQSSGDDKQLFRVTPLVQADLVEVTVINNPPPEKSGRASHSKLAGADAAEKPPQPSKYVQATSKTTDTGVQMVTCDGDNNSPTKKSKRKRLKLVPRIFRAKKKK
ncbi:uncharacterized protein LOC144130501 isoform X2 [Amblyomma americanum]